jgi:predicted GNAT family N-acyltransferase
MPSVRLEDQAATQAMYMSYGQDKRDAPLHVSSGISHYALWRLGPVDFG